MSRRLRPTSVDVIASWTDRRRADYGQAGSAYIITLLVLFVLTALGLSLTLVTSTESTMGSQERTIQRTFYAADSGLNLALASVTARNSCDQRCQPIRDDSPDLFNSSGMRDVLELTSTFPVLDQPCSLCQINDNQYVNVNYAVNALARRSPNNSLIPAAQRRMSQMFRLDPWLPASECYVDPDPCADSASILPGGGVTESGL